MNQQSSLRRRIGVALALLAFAFTLTGCPDQTSQSVSQTPGTLSQSAQDAINDIKENASRRIQNIAAQGTKVFFNDGCEYEYRGESWLATGWCRITVGTGVTDLTLNGVKQWRVDISDPTVEAYFSYQSQQWTGKRTRDGADVVKTKYGWLTPAEYQARVTQEVQAQTAAQQKAARDQAQQLLNQVEEAKIRAAKLWLQPACNSSYNGCR